MLFDRGSDRLGNTATFSRETTLKKSLAFFCSVPCCVHCVDIYFRKSRKTWILSAGRCMLKRAVGTRRLSCLSKCQAGGKFRKRSTEETHQADEDHSALSSFRLLFLDEARGVFRGAQTKEDHCSSSSSTRSRYFGFSDVVLIRELAFEEVRRKVR